MRTTTIPCDAKNLLFYCLLHKLGCCFARSLQARSLRSNKDLTRYPVRPLTLIQSKAQGLNYFYKIGSIYFPLASLQTQAGVLYQIKLLTVLNNKWPLKTTHLMSSMTMAKAEKIKAKMYVN